MPTLTNRVFIGLLLDSYVKVRFIEHVKYAAPSWKHETYIRCLFLFVL